MSEIFRDYTFTRDAEGMPTAMHWRGDYQLPRKLTPAEVDAVKLAEHERIYGKRETEKS